MKKAIASPLSSAFVIPGLGQILNKELKKGILLLGGVFLLFIIGVIKIVQLIKAIIQAGHLESLTPDDIMLRLKAQDSSLLWVIMALFTALWLYSVIDAFLQGRKIDMAEEEHAS